MSERKIKIGALPKRAQSVPKRVQFAATPSVYAARPQQLFNYTLTSANFPDKPSAEPALVNEEYRPPPIDSGIFTIKNLILLIFTCFLAAFLVIQARAVLSGTHKQTLKDLQVSGQIVIPVHQIMAEEARKTNNEDRARLYSVFVALLMLVITCIMWLKTC